MSEDPEATRARALRPAELEREAAARRGAAIDAIVESYESLQIRLYSKIRFAILRQPFLEEIGQYLPTEGDVLDLGCGFGLFSLYYTIAESGRRITGVDRSERRIAYARASAAKLGLANVEYHVSDALEWRSPRRFDAVYFLDLVHHLPAERVPAFLAGARRLLRDRGILVIKEVAPTPRYKLWFALALDRLVVGREPIRYWAPEELMGILTGLGFSVVRHRMTDFLPYPHILYICRLP